MTIQDGEQGSGVEGREVSESELDGQSAAETLEEIEQRELEELEDASTSKLAPIQIIMGIIVLALVIWLLVTKTQL